MCEFNEQLEKERLMSLKKWAEDYKAVEGITVKEPKAPNFNPTDVIAMVNKLRAQVANVTITPDEAESKLTVFNMTQMISSMMFASQSLLHIGFPESKEKENLMRKEGNSLDDNSVENSNKTIQKEVLVKFTQNCFEIEDIVSAEHVYYYPMCSKVPIGVNCIVCGRKFKTVGALLFHLSEKYPQLRYRVQRQPVVDEKTNHLLYNEVFIYLGCIPDDEIVQLQKVPGEHYLLKMHKVLMRRLSTVIGLFGSSEEWKIRCLKKLPIDSKMFCTNCRINKDLWISHSISKINIHEDLRNEQIFKPIFFDMMFTAFMSKVGPELFVLGNFSILMAFLMTHEPLFVVKHLEFARWFKQIVAQYPEFSQGSILKTFLLNKCENVYYMGYEEEETWPFSRLWEDEEKTRIFSQKNPKFRLLKKIVSSPMPQTSEERQKFLKQCSDDSFTGKETGVLKALFPFHNKNGVEVLIPKCLYFGVDMNEDLPETEIKTICWKSTFFNT